MAAGFLRNIVIENSGEHADWVIENLDKLATGAAERDLHIFMGMVPRRLGKSDLQITESDRVGIDAAFPGWSLADWSIDEAARVLALAVFQRLRPFSDLFKDLRRTADAAELIALYRGLPLYPEPETLGFELGEGLRSNLRPAFEAIAHNNPFPRDHFDEHRWNHMILKALFIDCELEPVIGLDDRANPELARIMREFAHERWAAGRPRSPELWRCVGPFAVDDEAVADLARGLESDGPEAAGAALGLASSPAAAAVDVLQASPFATAVKSGQLTWSNLKGFSL